MKKSSSPALAVLLIAGAAVACNLSKVWPDKTEPTVRRCFTPGTTTESRAANNSPAAISGNKQAPAHQQPEDLLTSEEGGFSIKLPAGFPSPHPPEPMRQGYEYA